MTTKQVLIDLISQIQKGIKIQEGIINDLQDDTNEPLEELKGKLEKVVDLLPAAEGSLGGRRRSSKKRGTQRKQKRRQRRGSRRAY